MKKWIKITLSLVFILAITVGAYVWFFMYNKPHRNIEDAKPDYTLTAENLLQEFETNDTASNQKYNEKVLQFSGKLSKIEPADTTVSLVFDYGTKNVITAQVLPKYKTEMQGLQAGTSITVKGLYNGFLAGDELFELPGNILLNKCSPVK